MQPHNHWGTDRTYFRVHQSRVTAPCTGWAGAEASCCWHGWVRSWVGVVLAGAEILCLSAVCLLPLGRKDFEQSDELLMLAIESGFPSSAEKWTICRKTSLILWSSNVYLGQGLYFFKSVFASDGTAFAAAHCPEEQRPHVAAWAHLNCRVTALNSKTRIFLHWQLLLDCCPQLLLRLLFKTWTVFHLCSSTGAAPEKVTVVETMAYSFLSLLPIAVWCYPSFLPTGKVKFFKVSSGESQKACVVLGV